MVIGVYIFWAERDFIDLFIVLLAALFQLRHFIGMFMVIHKRSVNISNTEFMSICEGLWGETASLNVLTDEPHTDAMTRDPRLPTEYIRSLHNSCVFLLYSQLCDCIGSYPINRFDVCTLS